VTVREALRAAGVSASVADAEAPRAETAMREADITTQRRASYFLAQVLHESGGLRYFEEIASGAAYEGRRDLGNTRRGDGRRFKGRGPIQLTGRANYRAAGKDLGLPLERNPKLAARHDVGWRVAAWYWRTRGLNALADAGDFVGVTRRINGGTNGLNDRSRYLGRIDDVDCRPGVAKHEADPRYGLLTKGEREAVDRLLAARRVKYRHGGSWAKVPNWSTKAAAASARIAVLLARIAVGSRSNRPKRRAYLRKVLRHGSMTRP
jgi:predicted chitinase